MAIINVVPEYPNCPHLTTTSPNEELWKTRREELLKWNDRYKSEKEARESRKRLEEELGKIDKILYSVPRAAWRGAWRTLSNLQGVVKDKIRRAKTSEEAFAGTLRSTGPVSGRTIDRQQGRYDRGDSGAAGWSWRDHDD